MLIKRRVMWRKSWKINTFSAEKYFFMKNILARTFLKKTSFTSLFKQIVHPSSTSYIDFSGSNNPIGENHESNRRGEKTSIKILGFSIWNLNCKTTQNRGLFFNVNSLSLFQDTTGSSFSYFSNITLFQKCNKTKAMILISLLHKTWLTKAIQFWTRR